MQQKIIYTCILYLSVLIYFVSNEHKKRFAFLGQKVIMIKLFWLSLALLLFPVLLLLGFGDGRMGDRVFVGFAGE